MKLFQWLKNLLTGEAYVFDIETDGLLDEGSRVHCLVVHELRTRQVYRFGPSEIRSGLDLLSKAQFLVAHNGIDFDAAFIRKIYPDVVLPEVVDTLVLSRLFYTDIKDLDFRKRDKDPSYGLPQKLYGRHSLESWGYRLGELKGEYGKTTDWKTYTPEMLEYCEQDVRVTVKLFEHLITKLADHSERSVEIEHQFATIIQRQVRRGWAFDEKAAVKLYAELVAKRQKITESMSEVFPGWYEETKTPEYYEFRGYKETTKTKLKEKLKPKIKSGEIEIDSLAAYNAEIAAGPLKKKHTPFNPGSRQHIYRVFKEKYNWKPQEFTPGGDPKIDDDVLASLKYPEAEILAEYFLLDKRIGQLAEGNQAWLKLVKNGRIHGSVNTNGAVTGRCTHSHPNVAQVPANRAPYGEQCRALFTASEGLVLVGADAASLELRCLAHYMAHWDGGKYGLVVTTGDIHAVNQEAAGLPTRDNAKTFIYAFLYGAGDTKIGSIVGSGRQAGKVLKERFLKTLPALGSLSKTVKSAANKGYIKGLDGRRLSIRSPHAALNTLLQSAGAVIMKVTLIKADAALQLAGYRPGVDYEFVGNIHDEIQAETKPDIAEDVGKILVSSIAEAGADLKFQCPLDGNYNIGKTWKETH